jgi:chloramphenicol-sensitive protein RarD
MNSYLAFSPHRCYYTLRLADLGGIEILPEDEKKRYQVGMICAVGCMVIWGFMPIYWKALFPINSYVIILYRIALVGITSFFVALKAYGIEGIKAPLKQKKTILKLFLTGLVITLNWNVYIYAVSTNQVIETCIGYYIDPLVVCIFGMVIFKERPNKYKLISIIAACIGVAIVLIHFMRLPLIALTLALSFAVYTAIKKHLRLQAAISIMYETIFLVPIAISAIVYLEMNGKGAVGVAEPYQLVLLSLAGILTATPLMMFTVGANRISLISLGIIEYIGPSITLLIGIFLFKEAFDFVQFMAFVVIWIGLVFFTYGEIKENRK